MNRLCKQLRKLGQKDFWAKKIRTGLGMFGHRSEPVVVSGTVLYNIGEFAVDDARSKSDGHILLTLKQRKEVKQPTRIRLNKKAGAVFPINPSVSYLISTYYNNLDISQTGNKITMQGELRQDVLRLFGEYFGLFKRGNALVFKFKNPKMLELGVEELERRNVVLPKPQQGCLRFTYGNTYYKIHDSTLRAETYRLRRALEGYFPDNPFEFSYSTNYNFDFRKLYEGIDQLKKDETAFWNRLYFDMYGNGFQVSQHHRTIAFDFETEQELFERIALLKSFSYFDIYHLKERHRYKFNVQLDMGGKELRAELKKTFPNLVVKLENEGKRLLLQQIG